MTESQHTEWKRLWRDDYLKWICGFANAEGGVLVIGRDDSGETVGITAAAKLMEDIPNKVRDTLGVMVDVNLLQENGKDLLEIRVEPYPSPINYKGEYYYRSGSTNQLLKGAALDRFLLRKYGRTWDGSPLPGLSLEKLDGKALQTFRKLAAKSQRLPETVLAEADEVLLDKLHMVEGAYLTPAAALLFSAEPERFIGGAYVKIGYFESNVDLRYQDVIEGDLISQVNQTIDVLKAKYLRAWITYDELLRVETWPVPMPALREAVLNAVIHKDYAGGIPIQISVYPDKLMIWNPGELPPSWDVNKLLGKHSSMPFNPNVANAFFRTGLIEAWGRGIERILDACHEAGSPNPEVTCDSNGLWMTFHFLPEHQMPGGAGAVQETAKTAKTAQTAEREPSTSRAETPVETPVKTRVETPDKILAALQHNPEATLAEVAEAIGKSLSAVERATAKLVKQGRLRFVGPRKGGHWELIK